MVRSNFSSFIVAFLNVIKNKTEQQYHKIKYKKKNNYFCQCGSLKQQHFLLSVHFYDICISDFSFSIKEVPLSTSLRSTMGNAQHLYLEPASLIIACDETLFIE